MADSTVALTFCFYKRIDICLYVFDWVVVQLSYNYVLFYITYLKLLFMVSSGNASYNSLEDSGWINHYFINTSVESAQYPIFKKKKQNKKKKLEHTISN